MVWIDYKKACDIVPQNWIIECFKTYKISNDVIKFIKNITENRRAKLKAEGKR